MRRSILISVSIVVALFVFSFSGLAQTQVKTGYETGVQHQNAAGAAQSDRVRLSILVNLAVAGCELFQLTLQPRSQISVATELFGCLTTLSYRDAKGQA